LTLNHPPSIIVRAGIQSAENSILSNPNSHYKSPKQKSRGQRGEIIQ